MRCSLIFLRVQSPNFIVIRLDCRASAVGHESSMVTFKVHADICMRELHDSERRKFFYSLLFLYSTMLLYAIRLILGYTRLKYGLF